ncbi:hypothetical protein SeLEV6574_g02040 [Synchytrium endobioticum]|uniref:Histone H1 n=1 Tax=Synchytrium endobioticum TaxID=286115 RepID=A0A507DAN8_9FUNG|nr:hypothetical protein SeLEV6574_g02040 [Synchytrium endobioticum]
MGITNNPILPVLLLRSMKPERAQWEKSASGEKVKNNAMTNRNINTAVRKWVDEGILAQPKGSSGPVKLVKKGASSSIAPKKREHQDYEAASTDAKKVRYFVTTVTFGIAL